jgi:DNA-binding response OmpR family regulator
MKRTRTAPRKTVLIAEDDETLAGLMADSLRDAGYLTRCAGDGIDAINLILETKPSSVLLDLGLPRLSGTDICGMVRKSEAVQHIPILIISGRSALQDRLQAFDMGADDYLTKPFEMDELVARVAAVLQRGHQARPVEAVPACAVE